MVDLDQLTAITLTARCEGKKIVLTGGIFDLLHRGHLRHLGEAKTWGDLLIVEIGNDALAREAKGPGRPVRPAEHRAQLVDGLKPVDYVIITQSLAHKEQIIRAVRPDFYVRGAEYLTKPFPERTLVESLGGQAVARKEPNLDSSTSMLNDACSLPERSLV